MFGSLLDSAVNTPKANRLSTGIDFGSSLSFPNFTIDEEINGFERTTTPSKFEEIIRSTFTSEESIRKAVSLAEKGGIIVNNNVRKQGLHSDWAVVIKEIPMNTPKDIIIVIVSEFGIIKSIKIQLVGMWQKAVVEFADSDQAVQLASRWSFLIEKDFICVVIAVGNCNIWTFRNQFRALLFTLPAGTTVHNLVVSSAFPSGGSSSGFGLLSNGASPLFSSSCYQVVNLNNHLVVLECSLKILLDQVSVILKKLSFVELVPLASSVCASLLAASVPLVPVVDSDMALDDALALANSPFSGGGESAAVLSSSGSKIFTSKMGSLEFKMSALKTLFSLILIVNKFDGVQIFSSGLDKGFHGAGVAIIMANSLACHVTKIEEVSGQVIVMCFLFKNKLLVSVIGLYAGAFSGTCFGQTFEVNSVIAKAVNSSCFVVLGGNFNENGSGRSASFKFCLELGLVNSFAGHLLSQFRDCSSAELLAVSGEFLDALAYADVDGIWVLLKKMLLINVWAKLDGSKAAVIANMIQVGGRSSDKAIECRMEKFCSDKSAMIKSMLDWLFHKVVLNYLVVGDDLVLEPDMVKLDVDEIMEGWTRKRTVLLVVPNIWTCQYALLDYVKDDTFSGVMHLIDMSELLLVVNNLPNGKAAGLSGIPNKLWKHCGDMVLKCLLGLLNSCLTVGNVPVLWKRAWTARKIFSKILSDRISLACSKFGVLRGNNFLVLKGTSMQSLVFAIRSVVKDALEKNRECVKICEKFVSFFANIHENRVNRVMTDFGLSNGYVVCDGLDQGKNILDIASGFFALNDISINNEKTVVILINQGVKVVSLCISGLPISIAKKGKTHHYLGIFLSTDRLSKPSLAKAHFDVRFFSNVVLRKTITNKQFLYLVSAVLQPIVSYHTQFSFVSSFVCCKWNVMLRKGLKSKVGLAHDFFTEALSYSSLYGLKSFEQVQSKGKLAALISFSNSFGILGCLFEQFGVAFGDKLFDKKGCVMSWETFRHWKRLDPRSPASRWFRVVSEFLCGGGTFLAASVGSTCFSGLSVLDTEEFSVVQDELHRIWSGSFEAFTDGSVRNYGCANVVSEAAAYFFALDLGVGIRVFGLLSSIMAELQAIALALECVSSSCTVVLHSDSQTAIDACISEMLLSVPNFRSSCWLERHRIFNLVHDKNLFVQWVKVKEHSEVHGNVRADAAAGDAAFSQFSLSVGVHEHFLVAENTLMSGNACYFVQNLYRFICHAWWEAGSG
ncbi:hypothetical protein G9A89_023560 [Geosiphon pyriformis]|nr:hypothetical protein G9A89_023560 [Geosiphon pyriformis]